MTDELLANAECTLLCVTAVLYTIILKVIMKYNTQSIISKRLMDYDCVANLTHAHFYFTYFSRLDRHTQPLAKGSEIATTAQPWPNHGPTMAQPWPNHGAFSLQDTTITVSPCSHLDGNHGCHGILLHIL